MKRRLTIQDYQALAAFRRGIRSYIRFSENVVRNADLESRQYQLLIALKGLPLTVRPRIAELARELQIRHHSAVELVDRLQARGLVQRERSTSDRREVLVKFTPAGEDLIARLANVHLNEVLVRGPDLLDALRGVMRRR